MEGRGFRVDSPGFRPPPPVSRKFRSNKDLGVEPLVFSGQGRSLTPLLSADRSGGMYLKDTRCFLRSIGLSKVEYPPGLGQSREEPGCGRAVFSLVSL